MILGVAVAAQGELAHSPYAVGLEAGELQEAQQHWVMLDILRGSLTAGPRAAQLNRCASRLHPLMQEDKLCCVPILLLMISKPGLLLQGR